MGDMADYHNDIEMQRCEDANEAYDIPCYPGRSYGHQPLTPYEWSQKMAKHNHHNMDCQGRASFAAHCDEDEIDVTAMQTPKRKARKNPNWKDEIDASIPIGAGSTNKRGYERNHVPEIIPAAAKVDEWGGIPNE